MEIDTDKKRAVITRALELCAGGEEYWNENLRHPFVDADGIQCATDGRIALMIRSMVRASDIKHQDGSGCPGLLGNFDPMDRYCTLTYDFVMFHPVDEGKNVKIGDSLIMWEQWDKAITVMKMLGLDGFDVIESRKRGDMLMFSNRNVLHQNDAVCLIMMCKGNGEANDHITIIENSSFFYGIFEHEGYEYLQQYEKHQKKVEAELKKKRHGNLWPVTVSMTGTFYVEAADEEEAKKMAKEHYEEADDDIFDDCCLELEGVQDDLVDLDDLPDRGDIIYTVDGWVDKEKYLDGLEEE